MLYIYAIPPIAEFIFFGIQELYLILCNLRTLLGRENLSILTLVWVTVYFCFFDYMTVWITINCGKFWKRWEYQTTWPISWETCMQVRKQQLELDMEQHTGSKQGKEYVKAVYCHPAYLTYMQSTSLEILGWKKHKIWNQDFQEKYQ